ncbi:hypothetical protein [Parerythrobacter lacustris]|uniref:Uncharacterized protein n=1 Tax=Parerythrobacter lacustris TaxID=2969984 RepID=A0ABT1XN87_9SPHN|nr:hypothetical protein [Parerythrobacter lacustris]MCR2832396.1 hypothetical protein [Parerythrobacter lacustris]
MFRVAHESPLRKPPQPVSERQIIFLDGIRYSADMAGIAIDRLWRQLCFIDSTEETIENHHIAEAALDAWSIIDAAHRMSDLIENLPGLPNSDWRRVFRHRVEDALELRDMWQHPVGEAAKVVEERGQAWGALSWMKHEENRPTGRWFLAVIGSDFKGSSWIFAGPAKAIPRVSTRRIRLIHMGKHVYLARLVRDMVEALRHLEDDIANKRLRLVGEAVNQERSSDWIMECSIMAVVSVDPAQQPSIGD